MGRQALMLKPKSIQRATKMRINQCDRLRTLASLLLCYGRKGKDVTQPSLLVDKYADLYHGIFEYA